MMKKSCGSDAYSPVYMKKKLREHFGDEIILTDLKGKSNIIPFRKTAAGIYMPFMGFHNLKTMKRKFR